MAERTFPSEGSSPIDAYSSTCDRPLAYFEMVVPAAQSTWYPALKVKITDARTAGTNYTSGVLIDYDNTGEKSIYLYGLTVDADISAKCGFAGLYVDVAQSGNPTIYFIYGLHVYITNVGTGCETVTGIRIQMHADNCTGDSYYMSFRRLGSGTYTAILNMETNCYASYLIKGSSRVMPYIEQAVGGSNTAVLRCKIDTVEYDIPLYLTS